MQTVKKGFRFGDISKAEALFKIYWNFKSGMFKRNLSGQKCVTLLPQVMRGTFSSELRSFICVLEPDFFEHTTFHGSICFLMVQYGISAGVLNRQSGNLFESGF